LDARLHPRRVGDIAVHGGVEIGQEADHRLAARGHRGSAGQPLLDDGSHRAFGRLQVWLQVVGQTGRIAERVSLRVILDEEVERVDHLHVGDQSDRDVQLGSLAGKDRPGEVVAERVLLPIQEVLGRRDGQRVGLDGRPRVRRRA
jgi:hypothetical protein